MLVVVVVLIVLVVLIWRAWSPRVEKFQESCQFKGLVQYPPEEITNLISHVQTQSNAELALYPDELKFGMAKVSGLSSSRISELTLGSRTKVRACTDACVCHGTDHYPRAAVVQVDDAAVIVEAPALELSLFPGVKAAAAVKVRLSQISGTIETDCSEQATITAAHVGKLEILTPAPNTPLGKLLASIPDHPGKIEYGLKEFILGRKFSLPGRVAGTPLVCN